MASFDLFLCLMQTCFFMRYLIIKAKLFQEETLYGYCRHVYLLAVSMHGVFSRLVPCLQFNLCEKFGSLLKLFK